VKTLWRYMGSRFLAAFFGSLVILTLVVLVVDMLVNIDEVLAMGATLTGTVRQLLVRTAALYLPYLIPVATFTGAFVCIGQSARAREILAMKAGGVSPLHALLPVFVLSLVVAALALLSSETLTVRAVASLNQQTDGEEPDLVDGAVWYHTGRFIYNLGATDPETGVVRDIRVYERDAAGRLVRSIRAREATRLGRQQWQFRDATIRHFDLSDPDAPPARERLHEVTLDLVETTGRKLREQELAATPVWSLARYVRDQRSRGGAPDRAAEVLHERLTAPLLVLLFALLAVPLGLRVEETRSLALPALEGVIVLFVFVSLRLYGGRLMPGGLAWLAPWIVVTAFLLYGSWQLRRVPQ
jgi:lipopolysaccharide export LptBFGC system permease protein LptF